MQQYYVYIMANPTLTTLYIGVTNDLERRVYEHRHRLVPGFTSRYNITLLMHYEAFDDINEAISREKEIKKWSRAKKERLIVQGNPEWEDLSRHVLNKYR